MKQHRLLIEVVALAILGALIVWCAFPRAIHETGVGSAVPARFEERAVATASHVASEPQPGEREPSVEVAPTASLAATRRDPLSDESLAQDLATAKDYREFVSRHLDAAKAGHHGAEYFISAALRFCDRNYKFYFQRGNRTRTLDQALQWASTRPALDIDDVQAVYDKCHTLKEQDASEFGCERVAGEGNQGGIRLQRSQLQATCS